MAVEETVCLASFIWYGLKLSIENENARRVSLAGPGRNRSPFFRRILHKCPPSHMSSMYSLRGLRKALSTCSSMPGLERSRPTHCFKSCISYLRRGTVYVLALILTVSNNGLPQVGPPRTRWYVQ